MIIPSWDATDDRLALSGASSESNHVEFNGVLLGPVDRPLERLDVWQWADVECRGRSGITDHHLIAEAFDEGPRDSCRHRRDEVHPVRGEAWREHGDRDHQAAQPSKSGIGPHHVAVGEDVRTADLDDPGHLGMVEGTREVIQDIADPDRLAVGADPARSDHDRQPLGQVAENLERSAARSDDHRCPELGDRHAVRRELGTGLVAARQVVREVGRVVAQATEVDDLRYVGACRGMREGASRPTVPLGKPGLAGTHRVGQVVGDLDPLERSRQRRWVEEVAGDHLRSREPGCEGAGIAAHQDEVVTPRLEQRNEAAPDVAAGTDDENAHGSSMRRDPPEPVSGLSEPPPGGIRARRNDGASGDAFARTQIVVATREGAATPGSG